MGNKKLTGVMFAAALTFTSCQNALQQPVADTEEAYVRAFIKEFGIIDPDHNWGFSDVSRSRACNTNGETQWVLPDAITDYERTAIVSYLNQADKTKIKTVTALNYTKYYITHVYANPHDVTALDGTNHTTSKKMNYLDVAETPEGNVLTGENCCHINDFNAAQNENFKGHMVMYDSGTYDFAYHCSVDNNNYNNYIIVAGADVDEYMKGVEYSGTDPKISLATHFYICFDYQMYPSGGQQPTKVRYGVKYTYTDGEDTHTSGEFYEPLEYLVTTENDYSTLPSEEWFKNEIKNACLSDNASVTANDITITNYSSLTVSYQNGDKWVNPDGIYDDWVIRIIGNAKRLDEDDKTIGTTSTSDDTPAEDFAHRIMVEDLSVTANYQYGASTSDWDFNDLVFDAKIDASGKATIKILALGGTLPIYIADPAGNYYGKELHRCFIDEEGSYTQMINTNAGPAMSPVTLKDELSGLTFDPGEYNSIRVIVDIDGDLKEIEAKHGKPTGKICVPVKKRWMGEKRNIKLDNPGFEDWVNDQGKNEWMFTNN